MTPCCPDMKQHIIKEDSYEAPTQGVPGVGNKRNTLIWLWIISFSFIWFKCKCCVFFKATWWQIYFSKLIIQMRCTPLPAFSGNGGVILASSLNNLGVWQSQKAFSSVFKDSGTATAGLVLFLDISVWINAEWTLRERENGIPYDSKIQNN